MFKIICVWCFRSEPLPILLPFYKNFGQNSVVVLFQFFDSWGLSMIFRMRTLKFYNNTDFWQNYSNLYISESLREITSEVTLDFYLVQFWNDSRLLKNSKFGKDQLKVTGRELPDELWYPDTYFLLVRDLLYSSEEQYIIIKHSESLEFNRKVRLKTPCTPNVMLFPFDVVECHMLLSSFGYDVSEVIFEWADFPGGSLYIDQNNNNVDHLGFFLKGTRSVDFFMPYGEKNFSTLQTIVYLERKFSAYLIQVYFPAALIVILSWTIFWINIEATPARASLGKQQLSPFHVNSIRRFKYPGFRKLQEILYEVWPEPEIFKQIRLSGSKSGSFLIFTALLTFLCLFQRIGNLFEKIWSTIALHSHEFWLFMVHDLKKLLYWISGFLLRKICKISDGERMLQFFVSSFLFSSYQKKNLEINFTWNHFFGFWVGLIWKLTRYRLIKVKTISTFLIHFRKILLPVNSFLLGIPPISCIKFHQKLSTCNLICSESIFPFFSCFAEAYFTSAKIYQLKINRIENKTPLPV